MEPRLLSIGCKSPGWAKRATPFLIPLVRESWEFSEGSFCLYKLDWIGFLTFQEPHEKREDIEGGEKGPTGIKILILDAGANMFTLRRTRDGHEWMLYIIALSNILPTLLNPTASTCSHAKRRSF